jgi:hypothetical protein
MGINNYVSKVKSMGRSGVVLDAGVQLVHAQRESGIICVRRVTIGGDGLGAGLASAPGVAPGFNASESWLPLAGEATGGMVGLGST